MRQIFIQGGPVMWPLLVCSCLSLMVTFERLIWFWRQRRLRRGRSAEQFLERIEAGTFNESGSPSDEAREPAIRVLVAGFFHRGPAMEQAMQLVADEHLQQARRGLGLLDTIITIAPLLGILGTVTGIIQSFDLLGDAGIQHPRQVVGGIAQALITTAAGLSIAVLTVVPFNWFTSLVQAEAHRISVLATRLQIACRPGQPRWHEEHEGSGTTDEDG